MPNAELAYRVLDHIDAHPESWNQGRWLSRPDQFDCETAGCFAGWACLLSGDVPRWSPDLPRVTPFVNINGGNDPLAIRRVSDRATELLDLPIYKADDLFDSCNTRQDLGELVEAFFGPRPTP